METSNFVLEKNQWISRPDTLRKSLDVIINVIEGVVS